MFIIDLTYTKPLSEVEKYLPDHIQYLEKYYESGHFMMSGRKDPRVGGVILAKGESLETITSIYHEDPFFINEIATYTVTTFIPSKWTADFQNILG